jgi:2-octaprenyl-6-methoxyphenol hydroxylase
VERITADVAVVGAGPAGLAAAVALSAAGVSVALIGVPASDTRTTALLASSVTALETLGVWRHCRDKAAPLKVMRIVDGTQRLWRAPEVRFACDEIGLEAFGWNIENRDLIAALTTAARETATLAWIAEDARTIDVDADGVTIMSSGGTSVSARLLVGADGRHSLCRAAAGIETDGWSYPQIAMAFNLRHTRPHSDISTEFHTEHGPFTLVPLPGLRSGLVWVTEPNETRRVGALDDAALAEEIEQRSHSILGKISLEPGRGQFPLAIETARQFAVHRVALVGEAAHALPPIGAQGFNLSVRDIATLAELVADAHRHGRDPGGPEITDAYDRTRRADTTTRKLTVDLLNRSLLSNFLAVQGARGLALYMLDHIGPLRRAFMREGVAPMSSAPRLMRGQRL